MKRLIYLAVAASIALGLSCAGTDDNNQVQFFSGVSKITIVSPADVGTLLPAGFSFNLPDDVKIANTVLGVFATTKPTQGPGNTFATNPNASGGLRSGLANFLINNSKNVTVARSALLTYDPAIGDFTSTFYNPAPGPNYWWVVWAYDSSGNLVASSAIQQVTF